MTVASTVSAATAIIDIVRNLGLLSIPFTLYFAWTKIGFRVIARITWSSRRHAASGIGHLTLINMKDRSLAIFEAYAVDKGMVFPLTEFDPPLILKAYEAVNIVVPEVSSYYLGDQPYEWKSARDLGKIDIFLSTSSRRVRCKHGGPPSIFGLAQKKNYVLVTTHTTRYNDRVFNNNIKYVIGYRLDGNERTAFVYKHGFIDWDFAFNMLRPQHMTSEQTVRAAIDASGLGKIIGNYFVDTPGKDRQRSTSIHK